MLNRPVFNYRKMNAGADTCYRSINQTRLVMASESFVVSCAHVWVSRRNISTAQNDQTNRGLSACQGQLLDLSFLLGPRR